MTDEEDTIFLQLDKTEVGIMALALWNFIDNESDPVVYLAAKILQNKIADCIVEQKFGGREPHV